MASALPPSGYPIVKPATLKTANRYTLSLVPLQSLEQSLGVQTAEGEPASILQSVTALCRAHHLNNRDMNNRVNPIRTEM
jgi:hypothetical protein